jgi:heat shock protein HslJ
MKKFLTIFGVLAIAGCVMQDNNPLLGHQFETTQNGTKITLHFDAAQSHLSGRVVNSYHAPYELAGDDIIVKNMASTMMMPIGKAADVEREYFKFMNDVQPKVYCISDDTLTITNGDGKEYKFEMLK